MQQIISYTQNTNVYHCPGNVQLPVANQSPFNYFNGTRAAYIASGHFDAVKESRITSASAYVLSGDTIDTAQYFTRDDCDKDDYSQNCVGGETNGVPAVQWQAHTKGQNILFADGHAKFFKSYAPGDMTFRYDSISGWN